MISVGKVAFTAVIAKKPDAEGRWYTLGLATQNEDGYRPIKETGDPADPFYVAKYPTRFNTYKEASDEADRLNEEIGLTRHDAAVIVASSMTGSHR